MRIFEYIATALYSLCKCKNQPGENSSTVNDHAQRLTIAARHKLTSSFAFRRKPVNVITKSAMDEQYNG